VQYEDNNQKALEKSIDVLLYFIYGEEGGEKEGEAKSQGVFAHILTD